MIVPVLRTVLHVPQFLMTSKMRTLLVYIAFPLVVSIYGVSAHPALAMAFAAGLGGSGPFVLVGVVIFAIGVPVGIALMEHYRSHHIPSPPPPAVPRGPPILVDTQTTDDSPDTATHSRAIPVPDSTRLLPGGEDAAEGASPSTALRSDPFSKSIRSENSSFTSKYTESVVGPNKARAGASLTPGNEIASRSKAEMDHILAGTDSTCEQAIDLIPAKINLSQSSIMRVLSDEIISSVFGMVTQAERSPGEGAGGSPRSSTKSSESNNSDPYDAEESTQGSEIFRAPTSVKSFSDDEATRIRVVSNKQGNEVSLLLVEAESSLSAEPASISPEIKGVLKQVKQLGLDGVSGQVQRNLAKSDFETCEVG